MKILKSEKRADKKNAEKRAFLFEVRAKEEDGKAVIEGTPIVFEQKTDIGGWFEETIARGALDNADMKDVPLLVNHDLKSLPVARSRRNNGNSTMTLTIGEKGLNMRAELDVKNNQQAAGLYSAVSRGDLDGMSFMFDVESEEWTDENSDYPKRRITGFSKIYEVSAVTFPAYSGTSLNARSVDTESEIRALLEKVRSNSGDCGQTKEENETETEKLKLQIEILSMA